MARYSIDKVRTRASLAPQREPYWSAPIDRGLYLGFRKLEQGGNWVARWWDSEIGKQHYTALGDANAMPHPDAVAAARKWAKLTQAGVNTHEVVTVGDACREYVKDRRREKGDANADDCAARFRRLVYGRPIGKVKLAHLRTSHLKEWRAGLKMAATSSNRNLAVFKAALNAAVLARHVDPAKRIEWQAVKLLPVTTRRDLYLTKEQRRTLIAALPKYARAFATALCLLPLRPGALAAAVVGDFDAERATLKITHDKAGAGRTIGLSVAAVELLQGQGADRDPTAPLLPYIGDAHWGMDGWVQLIRRTAAAAGLPQGTCLYSLRHAAITDLLVSGCDSLTVARMAGTSLQMLQRTYGHLLVEHAAESLQTLAL
jgi:integrase